MSNTINVVATRQVASVLQAIALFPPAWTRLEPQSVTGDPSPGLEARLHDPAWLLGRQWQFGEFRGEDAGTPIAVHIASTSQRLTAWRPGPATAGAPARALDPEHPLEAEVEREATPPAGPGLRQRAEAGALLLAMLADAGLDARAALLAACPLPIDAAAPTDPPPSGFAADPLWRVVARASPDGLTAAQQLEAGAPAWLGGAPEAATTAAQAWLDWFRAQVAPLDAPSPSWVAERLEYRFAVRAGSGDSQHVFEAPAHDGGPIDWYGFDHDPAGRLALQAEPETARETARETVGETASTTVLATPLRYAGMPADRLWQFEDGTVNFGRIDVQIHDPARLCFIEFASIFGNDWFSVPLDLPAGSFSRFEEVAYTTTFGERFVVRPADDSGRSGHFRMFGVSRVDQPDAVLPGLLVPPPGRASLHGRALEEIMFLRDESANMAWAIEKQVSARAGDPRNRGDERPPPAQRPQPQAGAELVYELETTVPENWIPLVPVPTDGNGGFKLRKGTMTDRDASVGEILRATPFDLQEEEVPREGVRVRRVPALARTGTGRSLRWVAREVSVGQGEGASRLAFDSATR